MTHFVLLSRILDPLREIQELVCVPCIYCVQGCITPRIELSIYVYRLSPYRMSSNSLETVNLTRRLSTIIKQPHSPPPALLTGHCDRTNPFSASHKHCPSRSYFPWTTPYPCARSCFTVVLRPLGIFVGGRKIKTRTKIPP